MHFGFFLKYEFPDLVILFMIIMNQQTNSTVIAVFSAQAVLFVYYHSQLSAVDF